MEGRCVPYTVASQKTPLRAAKVSLGLIRARQSLALPFLSLPGPPDIMDTPLKRPLLRVLHQTLAHRILPQILPLLRITLPVPQPVMKRMRLPPPILVRVQLPKLPLPIRHPIIERILDVVRRGEEMDVVRHDDVIAHQPLRRRQPNLLQPLMHEFIRKPQTPICRAKSIPNDVWPSEPDVNAPRRFFPPRLPKRFLAHAVRD